MKKICLLFAIILLAAGGILFCLAPGPLAMLIVGIMDALILAGFFISILPSTRFGHGFFTAANEVRSIRQTAPDNVWDALKDTKMLFKNDTLDELYADYKDRVAVADTEDTESQIEIDEVINEEAIELRTWQRVVSQIPNVLTAMGILGTFVGLLAGIQTIRFSSVEVAVNSLQTLLSGIGVAFYTSIAGVILSVLYSIASRTLWNMMLRNMDAFNRDFHLYVMPELKKRIKANE